AKVKFLLDQAECPVGNPPPMAMIINIPERVLLIKVSKMADLEGRTVGYTLVFHDVTEAVSADEPGSAPQRTKRQLLKIPTVSQNRIGLVDAEQVIFIRSDGHYTWVTTEEGTSFCNLNITDLEERLDSASFMRVHRSYLANLRYAEQILRQDGKTMLKLRGEAGSLPVSRTSTPRLLERLGLAASDSER
ncbi:MAG: LytTR family transcriptional regulator, partial [Pseudomonadota bacterium]|nr:LytTR family transcriptional regulator [Pseudomonadota bacterium]